MSQGTGPRRMPKTHLLLKKEMKLLREESPVMSEEELLRKILEARNLPIDQNDPLLERAGETAFHQGQILGAVGAFRGTFQACSE